MTNSTDPFDLNDIVAEVKQEAEPAFLPFAELYEQGLSIIERIASMRLLPDISARMTGFHKLLKLSEPTPEAGIEYPPEFKHYRPISIAEYRDFQLLWQNEIANRMADEVRDFWVPLIMPKAQAASSPLQLYTLQLLELASTYDSQFNGATHDVGISFAPSETLADKSAKCRAFVPEMSWFSERLRNSGITTGQILSIFPEAEAEILAISLGRAVVGRTGHIPPGRTKPIEHTFRTMPILFGAEPGQGKSTFANYFINALKSVGYDVATFKSMGSRFNMGTVAQAHIA